MRDLLFLAHRVPYPPDKGDKIRAWHMFRHLAQTHRMHLGCFIDDPADWEHLPALRAMCADLACFPLHPRRAQLKALLRLRPGQPLSLGYFHDRRLQRWVDAKLADPAIERVFVYSSAVAAYAMHAATARRVLDFVDVDSAKWTTYAAQARQPMRAVWAREGRTLLAFERRAAASYDYSMFVSEHEWQHFVALAPEAAGRSGWVSNGVDLAFFSPDLTFAPPFEPSGADLVFTARMDYRPNIDAAAWFAGSVLPVLRARRPAARFWIVGAAPTPEVRQLAALPGVQVTGRVPDTRPYIAAADVVVAPLRIARGIQNKILEAMAMGRPVVATPEAFAGVRATPGRDILLASGVDDTVRNIIDVLDGRHATLGAAGRRAVEAAHQWPVTLRPLDRLFGDTADTLERTPAGQAA
ncbi:MAG TPA: TIGR03087 family PEP-CTERM/XrtA system glycosyltransferase [Acetobacteraceae bacterium]|nr:TIGR03087 family PEP-CTERM/XrtA system glycosyltransferase [Acetobacteraceae bacterium]